MVKTKLWMVFVFVCFLGSSMGFSQSQTINKIVAFYDDNIQTAVDTPIEYLAYRDLVDELVRGYVKQPHSIKNPIADEIERRIVIPNKRLFVKQKITEREHPFLAAVLDKIREISLVLGPDPTIDDGRKHELISFYSLEGYHKDLMLKHGILLFENGYGYEDDLKMRGAMSIYDVIPKKLWSPYVTSSQFRGNYPSFIHPETGKSQKPNFYMFNAFWSEQENFLETYAHELGHQINNVEYHNTELFRPRTISTRTQRGCDDINKWLKERSDINGYTCSPQEYVAGLYNSWIKYGDEMLDRAIIQFEKGFKEPMSQYVYMLDVNSFFEGDVSYMYEYDQPRGIIVRIPVYIERNSQTGYIQKFTYGGKTYHLSLDADGLVTSYYVNQAPDFGLPLADTYVQGGSQYNTNFGTVDHIYLKNPAYENSYHHRDGLMRFYVGDLPTDQRTILRLNVKQLGNWYQKLEIFKVENDEWQELQVTQNNKPDREVLPYKIVPIPRNSSILEIDVTDLVQDAQIEDNIMTISLNVGESNYPFNYVKIFSKEATNSSMRPRLVSLPLAKNTSTTIADSYVQGGHQSNKNFGTVDHLLLKNPTNKRAYYYREGFMRFFVGDLPSHQQTTLKLHVKQVGNRNMKLELFSVRNDTWDELGITLNNKPSKSTYAVKRVSIPTDSDEIEINVTNLVRAAKNTDNILTIGLNVNESNYPTNYVRISTKESSDSEKWPRLIVTNLSADVIYPLADTFTQGGSQSNKNFGRDDSFKIKNSTNKTSYYHHDGFLKFYVGDISTEKKVLLNLSVKEILLPEVNVEIVQSLTSNWGEYSITASNKPSKMHGLEPVLGKVAQEDSKVVFDITELVKYADDNGILSVLINTIESDSPNHFVRFYSKEHRNPSLRPYIEIVDSTTTTSTFETNVDDSKNENLVEVDQKPKSELYPNPVISDAYLKLTSVDNTVAEIDVIDTFGNLVQTQTISLIKGEQTIHIPSLTNLRSGSYSVLIKINDSIERIQFVKY